MVDDPAIYSPLGGRVGQSRGVRNTRPTGVHEAVEGVKYVYGSTEPAVLGDGRE